MVCANNSVFACGGYTKLCLEVESSTAGTISGFREWIPAMYDMYSCY